MLDPGGKILASLALKELDQYIEANNLLSISQGGFRRGYSTLHQAFVLANLIEKYSDFKKASLYVAYIDFEKAFDRVDRTLLWQKMLKLNIPEGLVKIIALLYTNTWGCIRWGPQGELSKSIPIHNGLKQGCVLAPTLFNIYLQDLEQFIGGGQGLSPRIGSTEVGLLTYADDTVLLDLTPVGLQNKLSLLNEYCKQNNMNININKTKI